MKQRQEEIQKFNKKIKQKKQKRLNDKYEMVRRRGKRK